MLMMVLTMIKMRRMAHNNVVVTMTLTLSEAAYKLLLLMKYLVGLEGNLKRRSDCFRAR